MRATMLLSSAMLLLSTSMTWAQPVPATRADAPPAPTPAPAYVPPAPPVLVVEQPEPPRNGLHINPLAMALGVFGLGYERVLGEHVAIQLSGQYTRLWYSEDDAWAVGAELRPYFFFFRPAPGGMYLAPFGSLAYSRAQVGSATGEGVGWSVGATIGYSWLIGRHVTIRAGGGVQYLSLKAEAEANGLGASDGVKATAGYSGGMPALDFSVGYVF